MVEIETCPEDQRNSTDDARSCLKSSTTEEGGQSVTIFTAFGTALVSALITATICHIKNKNISEIRPVSRPDLEVNPTYGTVYYHLDR